MLSKVELIPFIIKQMENITVVFTLLLHMVNHFIKLILEI